MSRLRAAVSIATFAAVQGFAVAPAGAASILEDVLDALSGFYAAPLVDGDTLYVQSRGGKLYAIKRP